MKTTKFLFILLLPLLFAQGVKGQGYIPLVDTNKTWSTHVEAIDFYHTYWTKLTEDTLIDGKIYKKVINSDSIFYPNGELCGYIREDSSGKVFFMNTLFEEGLIYDFSANIGDTLIIHNKFENIFQYFFEYNEITVIVDTVFFSTEIPPYTFDNFYNMHYPMMHPIFFSDYIVRKVIVVKRIDIESKIDVWIEGIGSIAGVLHSRFPLCVDDCYDNYFLLLCSFENNFQVYFNYFYSTCFYTQLNINEIEKNFLSIFPNPIGGDDVLSITVNDEVVSLQIFDHQGKLADYQISDKSISKNQSVFLINISKISKGIFIIKLQTSNNILHGKIIKID